MRTLAGNEASVYLYGSLALDDFCPGWSDIDLLCLTREEISPVQAETLAALRQTLLADAPGNPYYRAFEGGMLALSTFQTGAPTRAVYWGTSGQRVTEHFCFDSFCMLELLDYGILLHGKDLRGALKRPSYQDLRRDVARHCETIRRYGASCGESLYAYGWLLDIARGLYTLRTGGVIAKTCAGEWALQNGLCPVPGALETAVALRKNPALFQSDPALRALAGALGEDVRRFNEVLENELTHTASAGGKG